MRRQLHHFFMKVFCCIQVAGLLSMKACTYRKEKGQPGSYNLQSVSYKDVYSHIFVPKCLGCHSQGGGDGGVNLVSFQSIKLYLPDIERVAIKEMSMPPGGPLSVNERELLSAWIKAGAPEISTGQGPAAIPPGPVPAIPLAPNFESLKANIFQQKCMGCHFTGGPIVDILFDKEEDLLNSPRDLVLPGDAASSTLYIAVSRTDGKRMPPPPPLSQWPALNPEEIAMIKKWIDEKI